MTNPFIFFDEFFSLYLLSFKLKSHCFSPDKTGKISVVFLLYDQYQGPKRCLNKFVVNVSKPDSDSNYNKIR